MKASEFIISRSAYCSLGDKDEFCSLQKLSHSRREVRVKTSEGLVLWFKLNEVRVLSDLEEEGIRLLGQCIGEGKLKKMVNKFFN